MAGRMVEPGSVGRNWEEGRFQAAGGVLVWAGALAACVGMRRTDARARGPLSTSHYPSVVLVTNSPYLKGAAWCVRCGKADRRAQLGQLCADVLERALEPCKKVMADSKLTFDQIDTIEVVGRTQRLRWL